MSVKKWYWVRVHFNDGTRIVREHTVVGDQETIVEAIYRATLEVYARHGKKPFKAELMPNDYKDFERICKERWNQVAGDDGKGKLCFSTAVGEVEVVRYIDLDTCKVLNVG